MGWTMRKNDAKQMVLDRLTMNNSIPMRASQFETLIGIKPRELRLIVRDLRMDGVKVCSGDPGYWLWDGHDDSWHRTKARMRSEQKRLNEVLAAMDGQPLEGQQCFMTVTQN